ncbi:MAG: hypothetical protein GY730_04085 [bacterium]|nr:hypothetical protein [bacterium]
MVKKLVLASCDPSKYRFPSGDNVVTAGWDGKLESEEANRFIPAGLSCWEFKTTSPAKLKSEADNDYKKRTAEIPKKERLNSTFIFGTSRNWTKKDSWIKTQKKMNEWKDIRVYDSEILVEWLEICPAVHRWFSKYIGKRSATLWDLEQAWNEFSNRTQLRLTTEFFLHSREKEQLEFSKYIQSPSVCKVKSNSKNEAYGFILSVLQNIDSADSRCVVIKSQDEWDVMSQSNYNLILIPLGFSPSGIGVAVTNGHQVVLCIDEKDVSDENIHLDRQPRLVREAALKKLNLNDNEVNALYQDTKGYFEPILRHKLLKPLDHLLPTWQNKYQPEVLFTVLFASEWDESDKKDDKDIITKLSGIKYENFQSQIYKLSKEEDPPVRQVGNIWQLISKTDYWLLIVSKITAPILERLGEVISIVLADTNPAYELTPDKRYMASVMGKEPKYSKFIKRGLSDSLNLLSAFGDEYASYLGGKKPSGYVCAWIRALFDNNKTIEFWFSLDHSTGDLAEAAPDEFLSAVEDISSGKDSILLKLFQAEDDSFMGGFYHTDLLWALEKLAWSKQYLSRATTCLARLAEIDPGGRIQNRPFNSLIDIYLGWISHTSATNEEKLRIINNVLRPQYPDVAWKLMKALLLNTSSFTSGIEKPIYKDWHESANNKVLNKNYHYYLSSMMDLFFDEVKSNFECRIFELIDNLDHFTDEQRNFIFEQMKYIDSKQLKNDKRIELLNLIRNTISRHREFPSSKSQWTDSTLESLEEIYEKIDFTYSLNSNKYLFNDSFPSLLHPMVRGVADYKEQQSLLIEKRIKAFEAIYTDSKKKGLIKLLSSCAFPSIIGHTAFYSKYKADCKKIALEWISKNNYQLSFAEGYLSALAKEQYNEAEHLLTSSSWKPKTKAKLLLCFPLNKKTLDIIVKLSKKEEQYYWSALNWYRLEDKDADLINYVASMLLTYDRPLAAMDSLSQLFYKRIETIDGQLLEMILKRVAIDPTDKERVNLQCLDYYLLKGIEYLQVNRPIPENEICYIEWLYTDVFRMKDFEPKILTEQISKDPSFFVQLVKWAYKRNDGISDMEKDLTEDLITQRARKACNILNLIKTLPGQSSSLIEKNKLMDWVLKARSLLEDADRTEIGDQTIGQYLSKSPEGDDNIWPHESIRHVIEAIKSKHLDIGLELGKRNSRGVTSRHPYSGGEQERILAEKYNFDANIIQFPFPRTAKILRSIAKAYERDGDWADRDVELRC